MYENLRYWVALNLLFAEHLHPLYKLSRSFPSLLEVFQAPKRDLVALGIDAKMAETLLSAQLLEKAEGEIARLKKMGCKILTIADDAYPEYLREITDPPVVLYYAGDLNILRLPAVAIVGSRKPTPYGRAVAERLAADLSGRGLVIVSGMARGVDSISHWGALNEGKTAAVLGSGLDVIYPKENRRLFEKIQDSGLVVTEYGLKSRPLAHHFPLRNRIISGLVLAVIVVEAAEKSGSLITARLGLEFNREVMAVPGNITSSLSKGTNLLIKMGAKLVETWEDVIEELPSSLRESLLERSPVKEKDLSALNPKERKIYEYLRPDTLMHVDTLVEWSGLSVSEILSYLLSLELKGLVNQCPGKNFQRKL
ncbi:MAG: DNA-protecting protein DprA [Candidatus Aminicenantes bacterium]|nr:DNA-protecting protein DprA [Candidatus Aminicenantes bacterium]